MKNSMELTENFNNASITEIKSNFDELKKLNLILFEQILDFYEFSDSDDDLKKINDYLVEVKNSEYSNSNEFYDKFVSLYDDLPNDKKLALKDIHQFSDELISQLAQILKIKDLISNFNFYYNIFSKLKIKEQ